MIEAYVQMTQCLINLMQCCFCSKSQNICICLKNSLFIFKYVEWSIVSCSAWVSPKFHCCILHPRICYMKGIHRDQITHYKLCYLNLFTGHTHPRLSPYDGKRSSGSRRTPHNCTPQHGKHVNLTETSLTFGSAS